MNKYKDYFANFIIGNNSSQTVTEEVPYIPDGYILPQGTEEIYPVGYNYLSSDNIPGHPTIRKRFVNDVTASSIIDISEKENCVIYYPKGYKSGFIILSMTSNLEELFSSFSGYINSFGTYFQESVYFTSATKNQYICSLLRSSFNTINSCHRISSYVRQVSSQNLNIRPQLKVTGILKDGTDVSNNIIIKNLSYKRTYNSKATEPYYSFDNEDILYIKDIPYSSDNLLTINLYLEEEEI